MPLASSLLYCHGAYAADRSLPLTLPDLPTIAAGPGPDPVPWAIYLLCAGHAPTPLCAVPGQITLQQPLPILPPACPWCPRRSRSDWIACRVHAPLLYSRACSFLALVNHYLLSASTPQPSLRLW